MIIIFPIGIIIITVFIRILGHVLISECLNIRTCSYYIETEGDFRFLNVPLKLKRVDILKHINLELSGLPRSIKHYKYIYLLGLGNVRKMRF